MFLSEFSIIEEISKRCLLTFIYKKFLLCSIRTSYVILSMYLTNYLGIAINKMFDNILININYNNELNIILVILILILMFQIGALVNLIIHTIIIFMILIKPIVSNIEYFKYILNIYLKSLYKYEITTTLRANQILQISDYNHQHQNYNHQNYIYI